MTDAELERQPPSATCRRVEGLLPWFERRTLDAAEAEAVRRHLESCAGCNEALEASRVLLRVAGSHPEVEAIATHAAGEGDRETRAALGRHLAECPACRDEVELADDAASRLERALGSRDQLRRGWKHWLIAAGLLGALISAWAIRDRQTLESRRAGLSAEFDRLSARAQGLESELASVDAARREVERRLTQSQLPRANDPVVELLPDLVLRGGKPSEAGAAQLPELATPETRLTLILALPPGSPRGPFRARWMDSAGNEVGRVVDLRPQAAGRLTLSLAAADLPAGRFVVELADERRVVATYSLAGSPLSTKPAQ